MPRAVRKQALHDRIGNTLHRTAPPDYCREPCRTLPRSGYARVNNDMRLIGIASGFRMILLSVLAIACLPTRVLPQEIGEITADGERAILTRPGLEITGAADPDVTIVEYFDYNCPYCKRVVPTFRQLIAGDEKLAIVYKDWPVLGESSVYAARCALAAGFQQKYFIAHDALLSGPRLSSHEQIESLLRSAGIDLGRLQQDLVAHAEEISALLARNDAEAHSLELDGTPGILVGRELLPGGADLPFFQQLIVAVRRAAHK
jgi:protein-disulfide isomerase